MAGNTVAQKRETTRKRSERHTHQRVQNSPRAVEPTASLDHMPVSLEGMLYLLGVPSDGASHIPFEHAPAIASRAESLANDTVTSLGAMGHLLSIADSAQIDHAELNTLGFFIQRLALEAEVWRSVASNALFVSSSTTR